MPLCRDAAPSAAALPFAAALRRTYNSGAAAGLRRARFVTRDAAERLSLGANFCSIASRERNQVMVLTPSTMLPLGTKAPDFSLLNVDGQIVSLADYAGAPALLVVFLCNHCPYVKHVAAGLAELARDYQARGVAVVGINSNDTSKYPADSPEQMVLEAENRGYTFAYLYDETQAVAKAYRAACTPDFYVFDKNQKLVYRGQLDSSRPDSGIPVTGRDLRAALDAVLAGQSPAAEQRASIGCNIKWKPGNEPDYFG